MTDDEEVLAVLTGEPTDESELEQDVDSLIHTAAELAYFHGAETNKQACERALCTLVAATCALAKASGMTEDDFGDALVQAWNDFDIEVGDLN